MKRLLISGLLSLMLCPPMGWATDATYINNGNITFPIAIDATNVINNGSFNLSTTLPYDTSNTRNFTNNGTMIGSVGFQFDNAPANTGTRKPSANFVNRLAGTITAAGGGTAPSYLMVSATNIINQGVLTAGGAGLLRLAGSDVNLSRSGVQIQPLFPQGSVNGYNTNWFTPDVAIYDQYWGQTNQTSDSSAIIQVGGGITNVTSPWSAVNYALFSRFISISGYERVGLVNPYGAFYTNTLAFTNLSLTNMGGFVTTTKVPATNIVQAVFVGVPAGNNISVGVRFYPGRSGEGIGFQTVTVGLTDISTNVVSASPELASLYLVDTLASKTNRGLYTNFTSIFAFRPQNYLLERSVPLEYSYGLSGNARFASDLLYKTNFASAVVTNDYAAYSAFVDNIASRPPNIPAGTVTNLPGRVEILADSLDMTRVRLRANGLLNIQARHLIGSSNAVVDCENLSYTLGSMTNDNLTIQNLAQESVARLKGTNFVWSGVWTNYMTDVYPNNYNTNTSPATRVPITNVVEFRIYAMILDAGSLLTQVPVIVNALVTHSTNVVVNDKMTVVQSFLIGGGTNGDGQSFTLNGGITFSNTFFTDTMGNKVLVSLENWIGTNAPNLKFFTNNGTLRIPNEAHFGDDRPIPYAAFVNHGTINAYGQYINSDYCELGGNNATAAAFTLITRSGKVEGGTVATGSDIYFYADVLKFNQATLQTGSRLDLTVTNSLFDSGGGAGNSFSCSAGFRLLLKPPTGDLLGTAFNTIAPPFAEVDHVWAGTNRGPSKTGFLNNTALGTLRLTPGNFEALFPPLFFFAGTGGTGVTNGLYVDNLDLSQLLDYQNELQIETNLVIYYAAAKLGFTPPLTNGVSQLPEEYLDGQFGGRLRWVRDFAGPGSSVAVVSNGVSILVNRALRNSLIIDSNGNGIPNGLEFFPFDNALVAQLAVTKQPALTAAVSWNAVAQKVYSVQAATNFISPNWQTVLSYTNTATTNGTVTVQIPVPPGSLRQFYRVGTTSP